MRKLAVLFLTMIFLSSPATAGQIYKWVNEDGTIGFTDDPQKIPTQYRDRVKVEKGISEKTRDVDTRATSKKKEEVTKKEHPPHEEPAARSNVSPEERRQVEEETRAVWENFQKSLSGK